MDTYGSIPASGELSWSPDGSRIALYLYGNIWTVNVADGTLRQWTNISPHAHWPTWSPDGRYILYSINVGRYNEPDSLSGLHLIDTGDGSQRAFFHDDTVITVASGPARFSPDGRQVVLAFATGTRTSASYDLFIMNADGTGYRRLTQMGGSAANPQWAADGSLIFFDFTPAPCLAGNSPERTTWVIKPDGTSLRRWPVNLGDPRVQFGFPFQLSPDGRRTAFVGLDSTGARGVVWVMNLDGTGRKQLTSF